MSILFKVGTSGYNYFWNEAKPSAFEWYLKQGFNTVEINATFYSFPYRSWVKSWKKAPNNFDFSIKVNRTITHYARLSEGSLKVFEKFNSILEEISDKISYWLFQMPPSFEYSEKNFERVLKFFNKIKTKANICIEFRDQSWWRREVFNKMEDLDLVFCSIDAPELPKDIITINGKIYLRLHGREEWYSYEYKESELDEICERIFELNPKSCYIYLNNDHGMLPNGKYLLKKLNIYP